MCLPYPVLLRREGGLSSREFNFRRNLFIIMQEISTDIYIEDSFPGVTLGAIICPHGQILIDAPFRAEDVRTWRSALLTLGTADRTLVNLDGHVDRTLGVRGMDCTVVAHQKVSEIFHARPVTFKAQTPETGADWEKFEGLGSIRWSPPEITFTHELSIYWEPFSVVFEYHGGSSVGATWVHLPDEKVLFVGDAVTPHQPPYLGCSDLPIWLANLKELLLPRWQEYLIIGGRGGLITKDEIQAQVAYLGKAAQALEFIAASGEDDAVAEVIPSLLSDFHFPADMREHYRRRLEWGLNQYIQRHEIKNGAEIVEE